MSDNISLAPEIRHTIYMSGKAMGEKLRKTATPAQSENIGHLLAINYLDSQNSRDGAAEAYDQGMWHGINDPLPLSVHVQNAGGKVI